MWNNTNLVLELHGNITLQYVKGMLHVRTHMSNPDAPSNS